MGTLGTRMRSGKKPAPRRTEPQKRPHPAVAKLAVALKEQREAVEQQAATAEILRIITSSPGDEQAVFDAILKSALRLCDAHLGLVNTWNGTTYRTVAQRGAKGAFAKWLFDRGDVKPLSFSVPAQVIREKRPLQIEDLKNSDAYRRRSPAAVQFADDGGVRTYVAVPLLKEGNVTGFIVLYRPVVRPFTQRQVAMVQTFADQAVIAIENTRLFNETKESLERQTATGEILASISGSVSDTRPVFDAIVRNLLRLFDTRYATVVLVREGQLHLAALQGEPGYEWVAGGFPRPLNDSNISGRAMLTGKVLQVAPCIGNPATPPRTAEIARKVGFDSIIAAPMIREGRVIGAITTARRDAVPFDDKQVALIQSFADQAVIAIENARLFNETKEALEQQTAISEILGVISSSPTDVQPVFDAVLKSATQLCEAHLGSLSLYDGEKYRTVAMRGATPEFAKYVAERGAYRSEGNLARIASELRPVHLADIREAAPYLERRPNSVKFVEMTGARSYLGVPLIKEGIFLGAIIIYRPEVRPFTEKQIALVSTFANQAVIAIENVRLFNETKESLERQTAISEILRVISSSPTDVQPVFDAIAHSAARLFDVRTTLILARGDRLEIGAMAGYDEESVRQFHEDFPRPIDRETTAGRTILDRVGQQIPDVDAPEIPEVLRRISHATGVRALLSAPMLREGAAIGAILLTRATPGLFSEKQAALLETFARQAVIAIENARLFNETKESLEQQTAISEVLRVISSSPADVKPVLDAVAVRAARICDASDSRIFLVEGDSYRYAAGFGDVGVLTPIIPLDRDTPSGRAIIDRAVQHVEDMQALPEGEFARARDIAQKSGWRTILIVPLLREGRALGTISLRRKTVRPFAEKQIALLQTFADQAAIAIENVRLFNATKEALEQQTATAEVLNVISGSIMDAGPVFDAISRSVLRLYGARSVSLVVRVGERVDRVGYAVADQSADDGTQALWPIPLDDKSLSGRAILGGELVHIKDVDAEPGLAEHSRAITQKSGVRSALVAPMFSMGSTIGALSVGRRAPGGFSEREVEMIRTFADQAVIGMENVRLFREIQEKSAQLEVASQHKSQFLASMSHELRTPLNALLGFNEMILGDIYGEVPDEMRPPLAQMQASGKHLLRLINNVLDLAKIESGRMELALAEYSVHDTVESVRSSLQPLAVEKGLEFLATVPADIPLAHGDPGRITQCLLNLAGNSLKFTRAGKVEISVAVSDGLLRYRVADTGIGIPPDKIEGLFTEFKQTDATVASEYGGTGLGLSISKKFVEMHGGRIWVESEPGRGSVFTFELPLRAKAA
jgi:GAF domain-containing protein